MNKETASSPENEKYMLIPREYVITQQPEDDEISLIELARIMARYKKTFYLIFFLVLSLGGSIGALREKQFEYKSTIEIGKIANEPVENPQTTKNKLENGFVPAVLTQFAEQNPEKTVPDVKVNLPKDATVIVLASRGPEEDAALHESLHQHVLKALQKSHAPVIDQYKAKIEEQLQVTLLDLSALEDDNHFRVEITRYKNRIARKNDEIKELQNNLELLQEQIKGLEKLRDLKIKDLKTANQQLEAFRKIQLDMLQQKNHNTGQQLLTQSMVNSEIQRLTKRVSDLEQYLEVTIDQERRKLQNQVQAAVLKIAQKKKELETIKFELAEFKLDRNEKIQKKTIEADAIKRKLKNIIETRFSADTQKSVKTVGLSFSGFVVISLVLALIFGVLGVFLMNLRIKLKMEK